MKKTVNKYYPLEVWGTSIILSPFVLLAGMIVNDFYNTSFDSIVILLLYLVYTIGLGALLFLPSLLLYNVAFKRTLNLPISAFWKKLILSIIGVSCVLVTFYLLNRTFFHFDDINEILMPFAYCLILFVAGFFFKLTKKETIQVKTEL